MAGSALRTSLSALALLFVLSVLAPGLVEEAEARGGRHPHFDDAGTLTWYHTLAEAGQAARREGKVIFVEYGRLRCSSCRVIVSRVLPDNRVRSRLSKIAVGLASECDRPERAVDQVLRTNLRGQNMLPYCAFLTPEGRWITGFAGHCSVSQFLGHLRTAECQVPCTACEPTPAPGRPVSRPTPPVDRNALARRQAEARQAEARRQAEVRRQAEARRQAAAREAEALALAKARREAEALARREAATRSLGSPDAGDFDGPALPTPHFAAAAPSTCEGCKAPRVRAPRGPLPPPVIVMGPPVLVSRGSPNTVASRAKPVSRSAPGTTRGGDRRAATRRMAEAAAKRKAWGEVLRLTAGEQTDPALLALRRRAHAWAHLELDLAVDAIAEDRFEAGLEGVKVVLLEMRGQPEAIDAERGLDAIRTLLELQYLNPEGQVAQVVRKNAYDELRGTRWAGLFGS